jgi:phage-related protein
LTIDTNISIIDEDSVLKKIEWIKASRRILREFPQETRQQAGAELQRVQEGKEPVDWRPMPSVGLGTIEIRIHEPHEHRVLYVAKFPEAIYVLWCFDKKMTKSPKMEIKTARKAYAEMQKQRQAKR